MRSSDAIYNDIGSILSGIAPQGACTVIMRAHLSQELDTCQYEYDSIGPDGEISWFAGGGRANTDMLALLIELRAWYVDNQLGAGMECWNECKVCLDLVYEKISISFIFP